jgi:hypothetical protein
MQQRKGASDYFYTFRPKDTPPLTLRFKKLHDQKYLVQVQSNKLDAVRYLYFNIPGRDTAMILYAPQGSSEILAIAGKYNIKVEVSEKEHDWPKVVGTHADTEKLLRAIAHEIDFNDETNTCRRT